MRAYLDWNATAPLAAPARAAMLEAAELGNPSSVHAEGRRARQVLDRARGQVAALCGSRPDRVLFTSGASEAAATLLTPLWRLGRGTLHFSRLLVTATDHPCVLSGGRFAPGLVNRLPVDGDGRLDLEALDAALAGAGAPLVATHLANNETGVIQDAEVIAARVHAAGGVLVVDAAQAPGRLALDLPSLGADALFLSSHKIGGPMGEKVRVDEEDGRRAVTYYRIVESAMRKAA